MEFDRSSFGQLRVLICDDDPDQYSTIKQCLQEDNIKCSKRMENEDEVRFALDQANQKRNWYDFVMIDIDLSNSEEKTNGIHLYNSIEKDFPDETYIIYSSQDLEDIRKQINRLMYRDVQIVLLDEVINKNNIRFQLNRLIQSVPPDRVFLVHGRNKKKNESIKNLLSEYFRLIVIDWETARERAQSDRDYIYDIVIAGIEMSHLTLVLFTDDEEVELRKKYRLPSDHDSNISMPRRQSRPNVYIEAGYAMGIRPKRTIFLEWPDRNKHFESPSDFAGMHTVRFSDSGTDREILKKRLEKARCKIKTKRNWKTATI